MFVWNNSSVNVTLLFSGKAKCYFVLQVRSIENSMGNWKIVNGGAKWTVNHPVREFKVEIIYMKVWRCFSFAQWYEKIYRTEVKLCKFLFFSLCSRGLGLLGPAGPYPTCLARSFALLLTNRKINTNIALIITHATYHV